MEPSQIDILQAHIAQIEAKLDRAMKVVKAADFFVYDYEHSTDRMACSAYDRLVYALKELEKK